MDEYLAQMRWLRKSLRYTLLGLGILFGLVIVFVALSVIAVDRTVYKKKEFYSIMKTRLDSLKDLTIPKASHGFHVGYAKQNLTPPFKTATAGYGNRRGKLYTAIHDSIFVRTVVVNNGTRRVAIVSADLLIIPPIVTERLTKELPSIGYAINNTYLTAIHSHNSIGNWGKGATTLLYGPYNPDVVTFIVDAIKASIVNATATLLPATIKAGSIPVESAVKNRLDDNGIIDSLLRVVEVHRDDSSKLLLMSYTAHATCLFSKDLELSRDYPGQLVDEMERNGYEFTMFLAGAMGSHMCKAPEMGWKCMDWMTQEISSAFMKRKHTLHTIEDTSLLMVRIPLALGEAQVKVLEDWRIRPWLFHAAFGEYPVYLTGLRWGNLIMLGTPCDFSGELTAPLDDLAKSKGLSTMVTSFNGGYIGYITLDKHYNSTHYETRLMNWYGPGNGAYMSECLSKMIEVLEK